MPFIGTQPDVGGYSVLDALTASATASYTLQKDSANFSPSSANQLLVSLNGVIQKPGSSFTVSGSTLTFSSALTSSDSIDFIIAMGEPLLIGTPSDGTVSTSKIADDAVTGAKIENNPTIAGNLGVTGDLTVDGNTLHVDSANNKVGLGVDPGTMPSFVTHAISVINGGGIGITSPSSGDNRLIFFGTGTSSSDVQLAAIKNTTSDLMFLGASGVEKARILNSGGISFNGDTAAANGLDDYEEGTFTATLVATGSTFQYTYRTGSYTKIGNCVNFNLYIQLDGGGNSFVGNAVSITGLPFTSNSAANNNFRYYVHGRYLNVDGSNYYYVTANLSNGSAAFSLNQAGDNVPNKALPATYLSSSSGQLFINGWYHI